MRIMRIKGALALILTLGAMTAPAWGQLVNLTTDVTGVLPAANGGTATSTSPLPVANGGTGITGASSSTSTTIFGASASVGASSNGGVALGDTASVAASSTDALAIGHNAAASGARSIAIGPSASTAAASSGVAIGYNCDAASSGLSICFGGTKAIVGDGSTGRISFPSGIVTSGASGTLGGLTMGNATSGTLSITPVTGALGATTLTAPAAVGTGRIVQLIASGTITLNPGALTTGTCSAAIDGGTATGVATTDNIDLTANSDLTATTGYTGVGTLVTLYKYPTANAVNVKVCNWTGASITPTSTTWNWKVWR